MNIIYRAREFAFSAHKNQFRKYSNEPYFVHPCEVAAIVSIVSSNENVIAAAYLHDVLEDCNISLTLLKQEFNIEIAKYVRELTNFYTRKKYPNLSRTNRKLFEAQRLENCSSNTQTIKLADRICNARDITQYNKEFSIVYVEETKQLLPRLNRGSTLLQNILQDEIAR